jgi:hypothetical protein
MTTLLTGSILMTYYGRSFGLQPRIKLAYSMLFVIMFTVPVLNVLYEHQLVSADACFMLTLVCG